MPRVMGIDYGIKKCGVAATDPLQIIVTAIGTYPTSDLLSFLKDYLKEEPVEKIVFGEPKHKDGISTYLQTHIDQLVDKISQLYPEIAIAFQDERMTSVGAKSIILRSGVSKSKRRDKGLVDKISAVLILQKYLGHL